MRRRRVGQREIRKDYWEPHEKVTIQGLNEADTQWVQDMSMRLRGTDASNAEMQVLSGTSRLATLVRGIVSWTLTDERGMGMPWPQLFDTKGNVIPENLEMRKRGIAELMPEDAQFVFEEINLLNQPMSKEEQEDFLQNATAGSAAKLNSSQMQLLTAQ